jgi:hypothetical protein
LNRTTKNFPDLNPTKNATYFWLEKMDNSVRHSFKENSSDEEDDQDDVGKDGGDPDDERVFSNSLDDALVQRKEIKTIILS